MNAEPAKTPRPTLTGRNTVAPAVQRLVEQGHLMPGQRILCFGCGRGADVSWLRIRKYKAEGYDPHPPYGYDKMPGGLFDVVLLVYLMTRLKTDDRRRETIQKAFRSVRPGGRLVVASRNFDNFIANADRPTAADHLRAMLPESEFDAFDVPDNLAAGKGICILARRAGVYRPQNPYTWVDDPAEAEAVCARLQREARIGLDVETTLDEPRTLCTVQLGTADHTYLLDALALKDLSPLKRLMEDDRVEKIIHNAFFEEQMLGQNHIRIHNIMDTLIASRKKHKKSGIDGGHKLGEVCERELGIHMDKALQTSDWTERPLSAAQLDYAAADAEVLVRLYDVFQPPEPPQPMELFTEE